MPIYESVCDKCGKRSEVVAQMGDQPPECCGGVMTRKYSSVAIRDSRSLTGKRNELFINRIDELNKRQADRGEKLKLPHPKEVLN